MLSVRQPMSLKGRKYSQPLWTRKAGAYPLHLFQDDSLSRYNLYFIVALQLSLTDAGLSAFRLDSSMMSLP
jgi:hypothetical protein